MTDETPKAEPSFLENVKAERESLEKVRDEIKEQVGKLEQLKAESILGGTANTGQTPVKPKEETPLEYARRVSGRG